MAPQVAGWTEAVGNRLPYDVEGAKGSCWLRPATPMGFEVDFRLPEQPLHQRRARLPGGDGDVGAHWRQGQAAHPAAGELLPMIQRSEASIYMLGWGVPTFDALYSLQSLTRSVGHGGDGNYNVGATKMSAWTTW